jgi:hypothetical protein
VRPWKLCSTAGHVCAAGPHLERHLEGVSRWPRRPELIQNTLSKGSFENFRSFCAARARISIGTALVWKFICAA